MFTPTPARPRRSNAPVIDAAVASNTLAPSPNQPHVKLVARRSDDRGHADHGWLKSFHTFNFARYHDPLFAGFGSLRIINEDRVEPMQGFGDHPHSEMEIFSYIVSGELEHRDSMENVEVLKQGDVQMTSAGTGIWHSEYNAHHKQDVHFVQIWVFPNTRHLPPKYYTRHFSEEEKRDRLLTIVAPLQSSTSGDVLISDDAQVSDQRDGKGPVPIHSGVSVHASILSPNKTVTYTFPSSSSETGTMPTSSPRRVYIHVIQTSGYYHNSPSLNPELEDPQNLLKTRARVRINGVGGLELSEGDGAFAVGRAGEMLEIDNVGEVDVEFLVFDVE